MYANNQPQGLPVSHTQPDQANYIATAPHQLPFTPNFAITQRMRPYNLMIAGYLIKCLQDNAAKNNLRTFAYNWISVNRWTNPQFEMVYLATSDYAECLIVTQGRPPEQAIVEAANLVATCIVAYFWAQFPDLQRITPPEAVPMLQQLLQQQQQISAQVASFQQQYSQPQQQQVQAWPTTGQQGFPQQQQQQWNQGNQQGWPQAIQQPVASSWPVAGQQPQASGWNTLTAGQQHPVRTNSPTSAVVNKTNLGRGGLVAKVHQPVVEEFGADNTVAPQPFTTRQSAPQPQQLQNRGWPTEQKPQPMSVEQAFQEFGIAPAPAVPVQPAPLAVATKAGIHEYDNNGVGYTRSEDPERPFDLLIFDDGTEVTPAHLSAWARTWSMEEPYAVSFNPDTHMKYHIRKTTANGDVEIKEFINRIKDEEKKTMEYLQHEIKNRSAYRLDESKLHAPVDWDRMAKMGENSIIGDIDAEELAILNRDNNVVITPAVESVHSHAEAEVLFLGNLIKSGDVGDDQVIHEYYYNHVTPLVLSKSHIGLVKGLTNTKTLTALASRLDDLETEGSIDTKLFNHLNRELTDRVNYALKYNLGYGDGVHIENFVEDIIDLKEFLDNANVGALWNILNEERSLDIIRSVVNVLMGEEYTQYLNRLLVNVPKDVRTQYQNVIGLYNRNSVTHLPWSFDYSISTESTMVNRAETPELYVALSNLLERTNGLVTKFHKHYIVDNQDRIAEVTPGYLANGAILIRLIDRI